MNQAFIAYSKAKGSRRTPAVEGSLTRSQEAAQLRLARIQNGAEPGYKNDKGRCSK